MRLLLDTHALLWWLDGNAKLSRKVRRLIEDAEADIIVSAATGWEISTKARLGKLDGALPVARRLPQVVSEQGFSVLAVTLAHGQRAGWLPGPHRDPFDRMLAAQAQDEGLPIATNDAAIARFGVETIW